VSLAATPVQLDRIVNIRLGETLASAFSGQLLHALEMSGIVNTVKSLPRDARFARHNDLSAFGLRPNKILHLVISNGIRHDEKSDAISAALTQLMSIISFSLMKSIVISVEVSNSSVVLLTVALEGQFQSRTITIQFSPISLVAC
jgi:hypothetical protein